MNHISSIHVEERCTKLHVLRPRACYDHVCHKISAKTSLYPFKELGIFCTLMVVARDIDSHHCHVVVVVVMVVVAAAAPPLGLRDES